MATSTSTISPSPFTPTTPSDTPFKTPYARPDWRVPSLEELFDSKSIEWEPLDALPLAAIDRAASRRNQARMEPIDPVLVETYKAAMENGDRFPPIVVRPIGKGAKMVLVDGNNRDEALSQLSAPAHPAYVINASDEMIRILLVELNKRHGKPLREEEKILHAVHLKDMGATIADAAAAVGLPEHKFKQHWTLTTAERRARERGPDVLKVWDGLAQGVKVRLATIRNDPAFQAAVFLASEAQLTAPEAGAMARNVNKLRTEAAQLAHLGDLRADLSDRIHSTGAGTLKGRSPSPRNRLMSSLGGIDKLDWRGLVAAVNPESRKEVAARARATAERLEKLADELESAGR